MLIEQEIRERFSRMSGSVNDRVDVLAKLTNTSPKVIRGIISTPIEPDHEEEMAADLFEPGTAIYKLVEERLETLDEIIKSATKEYEELARYIKHGA